MTSKLEELHKEAQDHYLTEFRESLAELLNTEPGEHPEIPEAIHRLFRLVYSTCEYSLQLAEAATQALVEHSVNQSITEATYHRLLITRKIFTPEEFQRTLVDTTERLGGGQAGTS